MGKRLYRRSILSVLIALFLACSIAGLTMMFSHYSAMADDETLSEDPPKYTIYLGEGGIDNKEQNVYYRPNFETGWGDVIELAQTAYKVDSTAYVKVVLAKDWVATANSVDGFGAGTANFINGRISVPAGTNITIDLNGHKIDRNLTVGVSNGQVFYVKGNLTIEDGASGGMITGGFNSPSSGSTYGGGILVEGGNLTLKGGSIEGNQVGGWAIYGIGVYVKDSGSFKMYGGTIKNHNFAAATNASDVFGGGVCVNGSASFTMYGGVIENNTAMNGGGVASYNATGTAINIEDGIIRNNHASGSTPTSTTQHGGGGIFAQYSGNVHIKGGEISNNTSNQYGGGVFVLTNQTNVMNLIISGGNIHHNVASSLTNSVYGGGVAVGIFNPRSVTVNVEITDGKIEYNQAVANCENTTAYVAQGGGLYAFCSTVTMSGGSISNNRAGSFRQGDAVGNLDNLCDGVGTYGGGVHVEKPLSGSYASKDNHLVLSGGTIADNRAGKGGGVNVNGIADIQGSNITGNRATYGGGLNLDDNARVSLSGDPVIYNNYTTLSGGTYQSNLQISAADERRPKIAGAFKEGARIGIVANKSFESDGLPFITSYGTHNSEFVSVDGKEADSEVAPTNGAWLYTNPYRYFVSDTAYIEDNASSVQQIAAQHILVLKNGELGISPKEVKFTVKYSDSSSKDYVLGKADQEELSWNCVDSTYGDSVYPVSLTAPEIDGAETVAVKQDAGVYPLTVKLNIGEEKEVEFAVVVRAKKLTSDEVTVTLSNDGFKYDGHEKFPQSCVVKLKETNSTMMAGRDYKLDYQNNTNAGLNTAIVVVTFTGNYAGEVRAYFTIAPSDSTDTFTKVTWQIKSGDGWITFASSAYGTTFKYDGTNQSAKIRAYLNVPGQTVAQTVYAYGVEADDALQNVGMWLEFNGNKLVEFKNVVEGGYHIEIIGYANYPLDTHSLSGVKMNPELLDIKSSDFGNYMDEAQTRLWQLQIGEGGEAIYTNLVDKAVYADPNASADEFDEKITQGELNDAYARYRGVVLAVILNGNYKLESGKYLQEWLDMATVTYVHDGETTGTMGQVHMVVTTVTINFGGNYILDDGSSEIVLTKTWYIVTMSNNLRNAASGEEIAETALEGWVFGTPWRELNIFAFRPEHGETVIYSYYLVGSDKPVRQFALVYSNDSFNAGMEFFHVKTVDGKLVVDLDSLINDSNYLLTVQHELRAGSYRLEVTVPQNQPLEGSHHHWWDNDEEATDYGVRYYEFTFKFSFEITTYSLVDASGALNTGIEYEFTDSSVEYNGMADNYARPVITLNGLELIEGVDYTLSSEDVKVGKATLTITGINSLTGMLKLVDAFEIVQGGNGWTDVPSIISWMYNGFNADINVISAKPNLLDDPSGLWFAISRDSAGADIIPGLNKFYIDENGHVSVDVAKILKGLSAGEYHLVVHVDETENYRGLDPNPVTFLVFATTNAWEVSPSVTSWVQGEYKKNGNHISVSPLYGNAHVVVKGEDGKVYYDSEKGIDNLASAKAGRYTLTASVEGTDDYSALDIYTVVFQIFEQPGLPWWAIMLIVIGALGIAALVIFILWKNGVFQIVTEKFVVAIRTRASVEATLASIRAAKMMEEGRQSVEDAKRRERLEKMRQKEEEQRELTPEEMAAQLEAQARADEKKAEKLRARSQESREKAAQMRAEESGAEKSATEDGETPNPETPTEE